MKYEITNIPAMHITRAIDYVAKLCRLSTLRLGSAISAHIKDVASVSLISYEGMDSSYQANFSSAGSYQGGMSLRAIHAKSPIAFNDCTRMGLVRLLAREFHNVSFSVVIAEGDLRGGLDHQADANKYRVVSFETEGYYVLESHHASDVSIEAFTRESGCLVLLALCSNYPGRVPQYMSDEVVQGLAATRTHLVVEVFDGEGYLICHFRPPA